MKVRVGARVGLGQGLELERREVAPVDVDAVTALARGDN